MQFYVGLNLSAKSLWTLSLGPRAGDSRIGIWGNYLFQHSRTQLSFGEGGLLLRITVVESLIHLIPDMWWLALCMIIMCVIERTKLENIADVLWFNIFSLSKRIPLPLLPDSCIDFACEAFETVSAYGTVGLSLGIPIVRHYASQILQYS